MTHFINMFLLLTHGLKQQLAVCLVNVSLCQMIVRKWCREDVGFTTGAPRNTSLFGQCEVHVYC